MTPVSEEPLIRKLLKNLLDFRGEIYDIDSCSSPVVFEPSKVTAEPAWQICGFFVPFCSYFNPHFPGEQLLHQPFLLLLELFQFGLLQGDFFVASG